GSVLPKFFNPMNKTIGVFTGSKTAPNIELAATNIGKSLSSNFTTHLISTSESFSDKVNGYDKAEGYTNGSSQLGEISALLSYLQSHSPDALFQITAPPLHGSIVGSIASIYNIPFIYRYNGDRFGEYHYSSGINRLSHFMLNNILGSYPLLLADSYITMGPAGKQQLVARGIDEKEISII
ncbi:hypothetical protein, partial [Halorubrum sp. Atlit-26R]|uniref:hypothetical protein n=1 Tax=Halorubrum sp. Atlit-26R TaxID=2282128 RepID=UPI00131493D0